ncbi:hypothetical protein NQ318_002153 [Aromia moschata]|uniref:Uncharacterized protein n=1 Tax=Aromia moschata TaxID=1265417 RepID=A0AAV8XHU9_9CUCU|nr:hypothetical protein NQ318_002153 [Aromia moschata]
MAALKLFSADTLSSRHPAARCRTGANTNLLNARSIGFQLHEDGAVMSAHHAGVRLWKKIPHMFSMGSNLDFLPAKAKH